MTAFKGSGETVAVFCDNVPCYLTRKLYSRLTANPASVADEFPSTTINVFLALLLRPLIEGVLPKRQVAL